MVNKMDKLSDLERAFLTRLKQVAPEIPLPTPQHQFHPRRKWAFDFAWVGAKVAVEMEGGTHVNGAHVRAQGYAKDCAKYNAAQLDGWIVLRYTSDMLSNDPVAVITDVQIALKMVAHDQEAHRLLINEVGRLRDALSMEGDGR